MRINYGICSEGYIYSLRDNVVVTSMYSHSEQDLKLGRFEFGLETGLRDVFWTNLLPLHIKNVHRVEHGMKPLKVEKIVPRWYLDYADDEVSLDDEFTAPNNVLSTLLNVSIAPLNNGIKSAYLGRPYKCHLMNDETMGKVWVFDLPSSEVKILQHILNGSEETSYLKIKPVNWKTYKWSN